MNTDEKSLCVNHKQEVILNCSINITLPAGKPQSLLLFLP